MKAAAVFLAAALGCAAALAVRAAEPGSLKTPAGFSGQAEPPPTRAEFEKGEGLFESICAHCHGPHMVNPGTWSFDLRKFPHDDRARFFNSVQNGKGPMPPWKDILKPGEIAAIWAYVRTGGKEPR